MFTTIIRNWCRPCKHKRNYFHWRNSEFSPKEKTAALFVWKCYPTKCFGIHNNLQNMIVYIELMKPLKYHRFISPSVIFFRSVGLSFLMKCITPNCKPTSLYYAIRSQILWYCMHCKTVLYFSSTLAG